MSYDNNQKSLKEYLKDAHMGKLLIPKFQRDFVWEKSKMIALIFGSTYHPLSEIGEW